MTSPANSLRINLFAAVVGGLGLSALVVALAWRLGPWREGQVVDHSRVVAHKASGPASSAQSVNPLLGLPAVDRAVSEPLRVVADRGLDEHTRLQPLVDGTVALIDQPQDVALMRRMLRDPTEGDTIRNEAANLLGRSQVKELVADLQAVLVHPAEAARFRSFAAQHLGLCWERAGYQPDLPEHRALQQALTDRHVEVRREALLALSRGKDPQVPTRIRELLADPTASDQHDLCCRLVADLGLTEHQATLQTLIGSSHESVAVAALDAVGRLKAASLRPAVETATTDPRPRVATTARRVLVLLGK